MSEKPWSKHELDIVFGGGVAIANELLSEYPINCTIFVGLRESLRKNIKTDMPEYSDEGIEEIIHGLETTYTMALLLSYPNYDENDVIIHFNFMIVMLLDKMVDYLHYEGLTIENARRYVEMTLKHEVGHIIDFNNRFVGLTEDEYLHILDIIKFEKKKYDEKYKDNNSGKRTTEEMYDYLNLEIEKRADNAVGLTWEDHLIENYK